MCQTCASGCGRCHEVMWVGWFFYGFELASISHPDCVSKKIDIFFRIFDRKKSIYFFLPEVGKNPKKNDKIDFFGQKSKNRNFFEKIAKKNIGFFCSGNWFLTQNRKKIDSWPKVEQILIFRRNRKKYRCFAPEIDFCPQNRKKSIFWPKIETIDYYYFALEIDFWPQNRKKIYFWHRNR